MTGLRFLGNQSLALSALAIALLAPACSPTGADSSQAMQTKLSHLTQVEELSSPGSFLVTPRWGPDGRHLLVSGHRGVGLYLIDTSTKSVKQIERRYRGRARLNHHGVIERLSRTKYQGDRPVFENQSVAVRYYERFGEVIVVSDGNALLLAKNAREPTVSSDGQLIAFTKGRLFHATLYVTTPQGELLATLPGAHPAWLPGQPVLVYARPQAEQRAGGNDQQVGADLFLLDLGDGQSTQLTHTPNVWEMQPVFAPDGSRLAYSDWREGKIGIANIEAVGGGR